MLHEVTVLKDSYKDSVRLLEATRAIQTADGVDYGWSVMATDANLETLTGEGFDGFGTVTANDLVIAIRSDNERTAAEALELAKSILFSVTTGSDDDTTASVDSLREAIAAQPDANLAIVSVPGPYATLETHKALTAGLDVLLFSDNVPLADEIELKQRARSLGRLVMGPGAGTAMLAGTGLAFANRVTPGPVGIVAAAGTGAQEVMSLLDRWGIGITHVIGVGGRDLSAEVGGLMALSAIDALEAHEETKAILFVSKPPSPEVAERLLGTSRSKPMIAAMIGLREELDGVADGISVCNTLEAGAALTARALNREVPDLIGDCADAVATAMMSLDQSRRRLVGLFSGGTLCYEAMTIAVPHIGPIHSNTPLDAAWTVPAPDGVHVCLDLGEEEYTVGRPHPMIDPQARLEWMSQQVDDPTVAVVLLDVVIGDGAHPDPAGLLAPAAREIIESGAAVVAYVLGTDSDPQQFEAQRTALREVGCIVPDTAARAALAACAFVNRDPALVHDEVSA
ncbi:MAG: protein FdrA [Ilumatobacter sp.]|uniref:protein FdrA n=1 Tax=Ilumatobacter sp. TaxID=1967498 RepID=UPI00391DF5B0